MGGIEVTMMAWFAEYAYQPILVYCVVTILMLASSFGLPLPEEVSLLAVGLLAYMGLHPDQFPLPSPDAQSINVHIAALVCFFAVLASDYIVFQLGKRFGPRLFESNLMKRLIKPTSLEKVQVWTEKHGYWACGVFRFTPGLRFPGHIACGMMKIPSWKFLAIDGTAALVSVPTQIYLIAFYGETILAKFKEFKILVFTILCFFIAVYVIRKFVLQRKISTSS